MMHNIKNEKAMFQDDSLLRQMAFNEEGCDIFFLVIAGNLSLFEKYPRLTQKRLSSI